MDLVRWRPILGPFRRLWDFGDIIEELGRPFLGDEESFPLVDLYEDGENIVVKTELPGMKKEDIHLSLDGDTLTIKGKRNMEREIKKRNYYYAERFYGNFSRRVYLPSKVKREGVTASYKDGVLEIILPKEKEDSSKEIKIS